jgi:RNA polymerase sigma factor (sigma-70 family)
MRIEVLGEHSISQQPRSYAEYRLFAVLSQVVDTGRVRHARLALRHTNHGRDLSNVEPFMSSSPVHSPERQAFTGELRGLLERAIDAVPDGMREVFVLREVEGLSTSEAAACLGVSEDVVKTRLSRGRAHLRRLLMERTGATAPAAFRFYRPRCDRVVAHVLASIAGGGPSAA